MTAGGENPATPRANDDGADILFLVRSLGVGGAERQLIYMAAGLAARGWRVDIISLYKTEQPIDQLEKTTARIRYVEKRGRWDIIGPFFRLRRMVKESRPKRIYCLMAVANIVGALLRASGLDFRLIWGVRVADESIVGSRFHRFLVALEQRFARSVDLIISNSQAAHRLLSRQKLPIPVIVVPNGTDVDRFKFDQGGRNRLRGEWNIANDETLVGLVGRLDPQKNHLGFLDAAGQAVRLNPKLRLVFIGTGSSDYAETIRLHAVSLCLEERLVWAGLHSDMPAVYSALDVLCLPSLYEGFPNVLIEALSCGTACIATDVGDAAVALGDFGDIVALGSATELAQAIMAPRPVSAAKRRTWVESNWSCDRLIDRLEDAL